MSQVPKTQYATIGGCDVAYQVLGEGPLDVVFLNGGTGHVDGDWEMPPFARAIQRLTSFSRLIRLDRRGAGASGPLPFDATFTWEDWAEDIRAVLDAVGCNRAAIFAELDAGPIAMLFAATHPDRTHALVIGNCSPRYLRDEDYPEGVSEETLEAMLEFVSASWGDEEQVRAMMPSVGEDASYRRAAAKLLRMSMTPQTARKQYEYILRRLDVRDVLASIRVPTLLFHSSQMPLIPIEQARYVVERIEGAKLIEIPGADVSVFGAAIDDVCDDIEEFLTGVRPAPQIDRALATVVFTDIVGSTEHATRIGDKRWLATLDRHDAIVKQELDRHRGRFIDSAGDGLLATFDGPARAIRCAQAICSSVRSLGIEVRAGLHTGEVELRGEGVGGIAVHIGQRVSALAGAGEVLVSRTVTDLVAGSGLEFEERGEHELKGVPGKWAIYAVKA